MYTLVLVVSFISFGSPAGVGVTSLSIPRLSLEQCQREGTKTIKELSLEGHHSGYGTHKTFVKFSCILSEK